MSRGPFWRLLLPTCPASEDSTNNDDESNKPADLVLHILRFGLVRKETLGDDKRSYSYLFLQWTVALANFTHCFEICGRIAAGCGAFFSWLSLGVAITVRWRLLEVRWTVVGEGREGDERSQITCTLCLRQLAVLDRFDASGKGRYHKLVCS